MDSENSFEDFSRRFHALMNEAQSYGIQTVVVLLESDNLNQTETKDILWRGGPIVAAGMAAYAQHRLLRHRPE